MKNQYPLLLIGLVAYIFTPSFLAWIIDPRDGWYKPYIIWLLVIVITYLVQRRKKSA